MARELVKGGFYKHFKNKLYKAIDVVYHSETKEALVLYQALYGDFKLYVRPIDMFLSEVDHIKYPEVKAKYRFTLVDIDAEGNVSDIEEDTASKTSANVGNTDYIANETSANSEAREDNLLVSNTKRVGELVERFLDSKEYEDKLDALLLLRSNINDDLIDLFAESLDIVVDKGDLNTRFKSLKSVLEAHTKYEGARLRR
ncbi:DUF1653 domain-containing protein [Lachnospira multipara]|uniref:DUF1653 domain-containing protein n=1 Tax=Lachnospira multipara TaxID=28051 RepID=UPI000485E426|nr:DUF1653 domain-containing protein [Lachnospira multipara]